MKMYEFYSLWVCPVSSKKWSIFAQMAHIIMFEILRVLNLSI